MKYKYKFLVSLFASYLLVPIAVLAAPVIGKPLHKIMLVVAMESEAKPLIRKFRLQHIKNFSHLPMQGYVGKFESFTIFLIQNGKDSIYKVQNVGTQAAVLSTYVGINYFHPDLVISIGTAGGIPKRGAKINDIYISQRINFYSRRITGLGYDEYGVGNYRSWNLQRYGKNLKKLHLKWGNICSNDSFTSNVEDLQSIEKNECAALDMEAAGVAWVSQLMKVPMLAVKGISDIAIEKESYEQYEANLDNVATLLAVKLETILASLI